MKYEIDKTYICLSFTEDNIFTVIKITDIIYIKWLGSERFDNFSPGSYFNAIDIPLTNITKLLYV